MELKLKSIPDLKVYVLNSLLGVTLFCLSFVLVFFPRLPFVF